MAWLAVAAALGLGAGPNAEPAAAQEGGSPADDFGGFVVSARSNGVQLTYDSPGTFPFSPVLQFSVPEALATLTAGPSGFARSSIAFPGELLGNLPALIEQSGSEAPPFIEAYSVKAEASSPGGPFEAQQTQGTATQIAQARGVDAYAKTSYSGMDVSPVASVGSVTSTSESTIEDGQVVARTRTVLGNVSLLAGLVHIDSITTDLVATSNGQKAATAGGTTVSGVTVLGLDAEITPTGTTITEAPASPDDPTGGPLGPLGDLLGPITGPLNDLLEGIGGARDEALTQLFEQSGINIRVAQPSETVDGPLGERSVEGVIVEIVYDGKTTPIMSDLLGSIPTDSLPTEALMPGLPVNTSPQALVNLLKETHIPTLAIGPGLVSANATPAFEADIAPMPSDDSMPVDTGTTDSPSFDSGTDSLPGDDFDSDVPALGAPSELASAPTTVNGRPILALGAALPAFFLIITALASPFFAMGSRKLADNTLDAVSSSCPDGLDRPPMEATT